MIVQNGIGYYSLSLSITRSQALESRIYTTPPQPAAAAGVSWYGLCSHSPIHSRRTCCMASYQSVQTDDQKLIKMRLRIRSSVNELTA